MPILQWMEVRRDTKTNFAVCLLCKFLRFLLWKNQYWTRLKTNKVINKVIKSKESRKLMKLEKNVCNTRCSQAVTHLSTNRARRSLSSEIERDRECSTWYGRRRKIELHFHYELNFFFTCCEEACFVLFRKGQKVLQ
jgi:hypothetical protein